jgi:hypothetical protein
MLIPLFLCIGFMICILYTDLVFDVSALPFRNTKANLPKDVLDPIITYYRYITKNPWLLIFVMLTAATSIGAQIMFGMVPASVGYASAALMAMVMLLGVLKVIPAAQRLAAGKDTEDRQTGLVHSLFPYHILLLILVLSLTYLQFSAASPQ